MLKMPKLILLEDFEGDWKLYLDAIYKCFCDDFIKQKVEYEGTKISLKKHPLLNGKEATFWHLISSGETETNRLPDLRRCERIKWSKAIIDNNGNNSIRIWENIRKGKNRVCLCFGDWEYVVILDKRKGYILLWTAYLITQRHTKLRMKKEYEKYIKSKNRP